MSRDAESAAGPVIDLRWMTSSHLEAVEQASELFDHEVGSEWTRRFLGESNHHLCIAYVDGRSVGMVTGVELTHPDKGTEMFLYELSVAEPHRRSGVGKTLVRALAELARERGCYGMWVLTDADNEAALRTYRSGGAGETDEAVMLTWRLDPTHITAAEAKIPD